MILYELKDKWDKKYVYVIYLFQLMFLLIYHLCMNSSGGYLQNFQKVQRSARFVFVCITFLSYEIFSDLQKQVWK